MTGKPTNYWAALSASIYYKYNWGCFQSFGDRILWLHSIPVSAHSPLTTDSFFPRPSDQEETFVLCLPTSVKLQPTFLGDHAIFLSRALLMSEETMAFNCTKIWDNWKNILTIPDMVNYLRPYISISLTLLWIRTRVSWYKSNSDLVDGAEHLHHQESPRGHLGCWNIFWTARL